MIISVLPMPQFELFLTLILIQEPLIICIIIHIPEKKKFQISFFLKNLLKYFASDTDPDMISLIIIA